MLKGSFYPTLGTKQERAEGGASVVLRLSDPQGIDLEHTDFVQNQIDEAMKMNAESYSVIADEAWDAEFKDHPVKTGKVSRT